MIGAILIHDGEALHPLILGARLVDEEVPLVHVGVEECDEGDDNSEEGGQGRGGKGLRPGRDAGLTREQRIQATRDERAGDRAVAAWARENAAELRQIAGQVSAVAGLTSAGRRDAKTLESSLTEDDPTSLIVPLADMREHLVDEHARLAAQVDAVGQKVRRVRRETQRRRDTPPQS